MLDRRLQTSFAFSKGIAVFLMIGIHSVIVSAIWYHHPLYETQDSGFGTAALSVFGFFTLTLPVLSGCLFRIDNDRQTIRHRFISVDWPHLIWLAYAFFLIEGFRNFVFGFQLTYFLAWNVLQTIALSYLLIAALARISVWFLAVSGAFILIATPWIHERLILTFVSAHIPFSAATFHPDHLELSLIAFASAIAVTALLFPVIKKLSGRHVYAKWAWLLIILVAAFFELRFEIKTEPRLFFTLREWPFAIWTGGGEGGNLWPFLNWFPTVVYGFLFAHFLVDYRSENKINLVHGVSFLILVIYFIFYFRTDYVQHLSPQTIESIDLFAAHPPTLIALMAFFTFYFLCVWRVAPKIHLLKISITSVFSRTILYIYFVHTLLVVIFVRLLHAIGCSYGVCLSLTISVVTTASYVIGLLIIRNSAMARDELRPPA